jgi:phosphatidylglycerophosphatase A
MSGIALKHCRHPAIFIATGFGVGLSPWAPGTVASLVALPVWWYGLSELPWPVALVVLAALCALATWCVAVTCRVASVGDDGAIVVDEWLGMWLTLLVCPRDLIAMTAAFVLFRLFDIFKPWPVSWADREVGGGLGVMLDDVLAGMLAALVLTVALNLPGT